MKIPQQMTKRQKDRLTVLNSKGITALQIAKILELPLVLVEEEIETRKQNLLKKRWTKDQSNEALDLYVKNVSLTEIANLTGKTRVQIARHFRNIRDDWVNEGTKYNYLNVDLRVKLAAKIERRENTDKRPIRMARARLPDKIRSKQLAGLAETLAYKENVLLDEWWQFGVLNSVEDDRLSLTAISKDNNRVTLIKKYTPNWKEVLLKLKGLMGEFVSVRVIQNYLPVVNAGAGTKKDVVYEPRMVDVTASEGIMSLAKSFPSDTRNQSFIGRYKWLRFGEFEAKSTSEHILIGNVDGRVMAFRKGSINSVLEQRLTDTLDMAEGQSILVCVDQKNPKPDGVLSVFVDAHIEEEGIETYNEDYNTIVETIARTKDEAAEANLTVQKKHKEIQQQLLEKEVQHTKQITELKFEFERETQEVQAQIKEQTGAFRRLEAELQRELLDYNEQERFLRDTKEGLQQYKVGVLAAAADQTGSGSTFQMKGLKVIQGEEAQWHDFNEAIKAFEGSGGEEAQELYKEIQDLKREVLKAHKNAAATSNTSEEEEGFEPPEPDYILNPEADLSLFDEKQPDPDSPMMAMMREMMAEVQSLKSSQQSFIEASAMTEFEVQELRDYSRAEDEELSTDNAKTEAEHKDILENVREFVGKPPRQLKVYVGHARNTLCLRAGIDLTREKPDNRIDVQFTKHIGKSTFLVHFPKYNHDAMLSIVRDSKDKNDFAVKSCLHLDGERWKEIEQEVTGQGGKRLTGKKPKQWLAYRKQIIAKLEAPKAKKKARG